MKLSTILKSAALGAGICIFAVGLVLAQTPPAPDAKTARQQARTDCEAGLKQDLKGDERREAMRKCMAEKRDTFKESRKESRKTERSNRRDAMRSCRDEIKNQRLTEDERRTAIEDCAGKKDPHFAKLAACRKEADEKKLERGDSAFRSHMRACMTRG